MPPVAKLIEIVKGGSLGAVKMVAIREHRFPFLVKVVYLEYFVMSAAGISFRFIISLLLIYNHGTTIRLITGIGST